jgi:hypothetical protein
VSFTGELSLASCQPLALSEAKVTLASVEPDEDQRVPTCCPVFEADL